MTDRIRELLEANNAYLERARRAEALLTRPVLDVLNERQRQIDQDNAFFSDDLQYRGELALAAACYAASTATPNSPNAVDWVSGFVRNAWPWHRTWWRPEDRRSDLVRAAALILAEIERLDREQGASIRQAHVDNGRVY